MAGKENQFHIYSTPNMIHQFAERLAHIRTTNQDEITEIENDNVVNVIDDIMDDEFLPDNIRHTERREYNENLYDRYVEPRYTDLGRVANLYNPIPLQKAKNMKPFIENAINIKKNKYPR